MLPTDITFSKHKRHTCNTMPLSLKFIYFYKNKMHIAEENLTSKYYSKGTRIYMAWPIFFCVCFLVALHLSFRYNIYRMRMRARRRAPNPPMAPPMAPPAAPALAPAAGSPKTAPMTAPLMAPRAAPPAAPATAWPLVERGKKQKKEWVSEY